MTGIKLIPFYLTYTTLFQDTYTYTWIFDTSRTRAQLSTAAVVHIHVCKMAEDSRSSSVVSRGRMDRSLDEIAAEMHSQQQQMFGRGYEGREFERVPHRERDSKRYEPYSSRRDYGHSERGGSTWRDRDRDEEESQGTRIFVANLNYTVSWQKLKDHMKRGK